MLNISNILKNKSFLTCVILTIILCFGYFFTNNSIGIDDEIMDIWSKLETNISINRPFNLIYYQFFKINSYVSAWLNLLAILFYFTGIYIFIDTVISNSNLPDSENPNYNINLFTLFSVIALSCPFIIYIFMFNEETILYSFNTILSALALYYLYKDNLKKYIFIILLFITIILSSYETPFLYTLLGIGFIEFLRITFNKSYSIKNLYKKWALISAIFIICYSLNMLIVKLFKNLYHIKYSRFDDFFKYDVTSLSTFMNSFFNTLKIFCKDFIITCSHNFGSILTIICYIIFAIIVLYFVIKNNKCFSKEEDKKQSKGIHILINGLYIMAVPFLIFLLLGNNDLPYRNYATVGFFNAFTIMLLFIIFRNRKLLSKIILVFAGLAVFYSSYEINKTLYTENLKFQNDKMYAYQIMYDLCRLNLTEKPLLFIGVRKNPELRYQYYKEAPEINISIFNWDRYDNRLKEIFTVREYYFMRELGLNIKGYAELPKKSKIHPLITALKEQIKDMNTYPQENSIKETKDYVIIKLGPSELEK